MRAINIFLVIEASRYEKLSFDVLLDPLALVCIKIWLHIY